MDAMDGCHTMDAIQLMPYSGYMDVIQCRYTYLLPYSMDAIQWMPWMDAMELMLWNGMNTIDGSHGMDTIDGCYGMEWNGYHRWIHSTEMNISMENTDVVTRVTTLRTLWLQDIEQAKDFKVTLAKRN